MSIRPSNRPRRTLVLRPAEVCLMLENFLPSALAEHDQIRFLRYLHLLTGGSNRVLEKLVDIYLRDDLFVEGIERQVRERWSRFVETTAVDTIKSELKAICRPQISADLANAIFGDDISRRAAVLLSEKMYIETMQRFGRFCGMAGTDDRSLMKNCLRRTCENHQPQELGPEAIAKLEKRLSAVIGD